MDVNASEQQMNAPRSVRLATGAMGTRFEFLLLGEDARLLRAAGEEAIEAIEDAHRRLSRFEPGGPIHQINALAGEAPVRVDDEVFALLERCERVRDASDGVFDAVRGRRAGEHESLILDADGRTVSLTGPALTIDLGGIAKGFGLDLAAEILREAGIRSALLHGGSSTVVAIGSPPGAEAWAVSLAGSLGEETSDGAAGGAAMLRDLALSVSSQRGDRPGHVVDPSTGTAASGAGWSACLGASAEATDAWSTALIVRGDRPLGMPAELTSVLGGENPAPAARWDAIGPASSCIVSAASVRSRVDAPDSNGDLS